MSFESKYTQNYNNNNKGPYVHRFLLTFNTNKAYSSQETALEGKKKLQKDLRAFMGDMESFINIYKSKTNRKKIDHQFSDVARDVDVDTGIEIGQYQKRLHAHMVVKWETDDPYFFQLKLNDMNAWFKNKGLDYYVNVKWVPDYNNVIRYVKKNKN